MDDETYNEHLVAVRSVLRNSTFPRCSDRRLIEAENAGLIRFHGWPSGHWQVTDAGRAALEGEKT